MNRKTEFWHIITKVHNKSYDEKNVKIGNCITLRFPHHNMGVQILDLKTGKHSVPYEVDFLCQVKKEIPHNELTNQLKRTILRKKYDNIVPWVKKERS